MLSVLASGMVADVVVRGTSLCRGQESRATVVRDCLAAVGVRRAAVTKTSWHRAPAAVVSRGTCLRCRSDGKLARRLAITHAVALPFTVVWRIVRWALAPRAAGVGASLELCTCVAPRTACVPFGAC